MSYWQKGCNDAKAGRGPVLPMQCEPPGSIANMGYVNGYDYGKRQYLGSLIGQRIMARALGSSDAAGVKDAKNG